MTTAVVAEPTTQPGRRHYGGHLEAFLPLYDRSVVALSLRIDGMFWLTVFAAIGLVLTRFVTGAWPWQGEDAARDRRFYLGALGLLAVGWLVVVIF